jgi:hypothetical protein
MGGVNRETLRQAQGKEGERGEGLGDTYRKAGRREGKNKR